MLFGFSKILQGGGKHYVIFFLYFWCIQSLLSDVLIMVFAIHNVTDNSNSNSNLIIHMWKTLEEKRERLNLYVALSNHLGPDVRSIIIEIQTFGM